MKLQMKSIVWVVTIAFLIPMGCRKEPGIPTKIGKNGFPRLAERPNAAFKLLGEGVKQIPAPHSPDKAEDKKPEITKTIEYRRFHKLLKQVVKAPPLRRSSKRPS